MVATRHFDAVVIGAGPAGSMAALSLARRGVRTLMIEKAREGRWKVCGCCLGAMGTEALRDAGLAHVLHGSSPLDAFTLAAKGKSTTLQLPGFATISRESLDRSLAEAAEAAGVETRWSTSASASPDGTATLNDGTEIGAGVIIDASGLRGQRTSQTRVAGTVRIGLGLTTRDAPCKPGELTMAVARGGYLGRVALPDGRVDFAAAVAPAFVRSSGSPINALRSIWQSAGLDPADVPDGQWRGTPALTRRRDTQDGRILRVGDAAGYVEPFTGEGMSWALLAASRIAGDAIACIQRGPGASTWPRTLRRAIAHRHARCRAVSMAVRFPSLVSTAVLVSGVAPRFGSRATGVLSGAVRSPA